MLSQVTADIRKVISENTGMRHYLEGLRSNADFTRRSWLYDSKDHSVYKEPDAVRDDWDTLLKSGLSKHDKRHASVLALEEGQKEKWGPQGGHPPIQELMHDVVLPSFELGRSAQHGTAAFDTAEWKQAKQWTTKLLQSVGCYNLRPWAIEKVPIDMHQRGTLFSNSGFPDFTKRKLPNVLARAVKDARDGAWKTYPAIALFRRYNGKTRLVWMFPMSTNLVEGSYFKPLYDRIANSHLADSLFAPWKGFEQVRRVVTKAYDAGYEIGASDFTSTDAHFQLATSEQVIDVLSPCFVRQAQDGLRESIVAMHEIPLLVSTGNMLTGSHGVASGSNWTNFIETVFDIVLGKYVEILTNGKVRLLYAIGDDMAWVSQKFPQSFREDLDRIGASVGQVIKAEKTMAEHDKVKTLQRLFIRGYRREDGLLRGIYPTMRALKSSIYPERFHHDWSADYFCDRQFEILENAVDHPLFTDFVRYILQGNPHLVAFAKKDAREIDAIHRKAKLIPGLVPTYNREKMDEKLSTFQSIATARTLV